MPTQAGSGSVGPELRAGSGLGGDQLGRGVAQDLAVPWSEPLGCCSERGEPLLNQRVPARFRHALAGGPAADQHSVFRPGQGDVEQAVVLLQPAGGDGIAQGLSGGAAQLLAWRPQRHVEAGFRVRGP